MRKERLCLKELFEKYSVEIPILQRDYAQGRRSKEDVAQKFLDAIFKALERGEGLHLDFIYGYVEKDEIGDRFILIDGQQRITTLWLLYFYLYRRVERLLEVRGWLERFSYNVRESSAKFCKNLLKQNLGLDKKPSEDIYGRGGVFEKQENLRNDPTIKAMIHMLDLLACRLEDKDPARMIENLDRITFDFFDMGRFELGEELYIKMNARGKQLSDYENLKAAIEERLRQEGGNDAELMGLMLSIDSLWSDYFGNFKAVENLEGVEKEIERFDERGRNFLHYGAVYFYAKGQDTKDIKAKLEYQSIDEIVELLYKNMALLDRTIGVLSALEGLVSEENLGIKGLEDLKSARFFDSKNDESDEIGRIKVCYFFLILSYMEHRTLEEIKASEASKAQFYDYLCVGRHLIENRALEDLRDIVSFVRLFAFLARVGENQDLYEYMRDTPRLGDSFHKEMYALEVRKAGLIAQSRQGGKLWEGVLSKTSKNPFLIGWVDFLLDFSDEGFRFSTKETKGANRYENPNFERFERYAALTLGLLDEDFLQENFLLFQRAWLSMGDYSFYETNWFYGGFPKGGLQKMTFENRALWNRLLAGRKLVDERACFKSFLDELDRRMGGEEIREEKLCGAMREMIKEAMASTSWRQKPWWEQLMIAREEIFGFIGGSVGNRVRCIPKTNTIDNFRKGDKRGAVAKVELLPRPMSRKGVKDVLDYGFYLYCKERGLELSEQHESDREQYGSYYVLASYFYLEGHEVLCNSMESAKGVVHQGPSIIIGDRNYPINLDEGCDVFAGFERVLEEARGDGVLSLAKGEKKG